MNTLKIALLSLTIPYFISASFANELTQSSLEQKANQGNAEAQYKLGKLYENSKGVPQDYNKAIEWYTKAAEQGNSYAQYSLGKLYENSKGVPQDYNKAIEWYTKAAEQGSIIAQGQLGELYEKISNKSANPDYFQSVEWYTKAANQKKISLPDQSIISMYWLPQNSYYKLQSLLSSQKFKNSQNIPKIKEYLKQDCLNKSQNSCDLFKQLNN